MANIRGPSSTRCDISSSSAWSSLLFIFPLFLISSFTVLPLSLYFSLAPALFSPPIFPAISFSLSLHTYYLPTLLDPLPYLHLSLPLSLYLSHLPSFPSFFNCISFPSLRLPFSPLLAHLLPFTFFYILTFYLSLFNTFFASLYSLHNSFYWTLSLLPDLFSVCPPCYLCFCLSVFLSNHLPVWLCPSASLSVPPHLLTHIFTMLVLNHAASRIRKSIISVLSFALLGSASNRLACMIIMKV